ncbi:putative pentatricopeptide repeat-containing protein At3g47840 [Nymphaea colorata]|uniref:Pentacotripeptide-repeat region of PRORP domain-containing protein n=1 Tax=Nymphaea colorata TaxID=210225 RepID=A0A5K0Z1X9_9MAGN|nr:putative pentatricopeptide repeat-containing protein At3g47840 [Nymphaea colorata]
MKWAPTGSYRLHFFSCTSAGSHRHQVSDEILQRNAAMPALRLLLPSLTADTSFPNTTALASLIRASTGSSSRREHGEQLHAFCIKTSRSSNTLVANALIAMYSKAGSIEAAETIFSKMADKDRVTLNTMVSVYEQNNQHQGAIGIFYRMCCTENKLDEFGLSSALRSCASMRALGLGRSIHAHSLKLSCLPNLCIQTAIIKLYCECGSIEGALLMFEEMPERDVICWNSIICGLVKNGRDVEAIRFFKEMIAVDDGADSYTLAALISSAYCLEKVSAGDQLHAYAINTGIISSLSVMNALITMYARSGRLHESKTVFQTMPGKNVVSWTAMISGCAQQGREEEALQLFSDMMRGTSAGVRPNQVTFMTAFDCCGNLATLLQGNMLLALVLKLGFASRVEVQNSMLSFFSECGRMEDAETTFKTIREPDIVSWNSLISGYCKQGRGSEALATFEKMQKNGVTPDSITFISLLSACRHAGLLHEGLTLFEKMIFHYGIEPQMEHLLCTVNLLARSGQLGLADKFIRQIDLKHQDVSLWRTLLGACRVHGNAEFASLAAEKVLEMESCNSEAFVVLSNIYAASGRWDMAGNFRRLMKNMNVIKQPGFSWIEVGNKVHCFVSASPSHPKINEIYAALIELSSHMKHCGE